MSNLQNNYQLFEREDIDFSTGLPLCETSEVKDNLRLQDLKEEDRYWNRVSSREAELERLDTLSF